MGTSSKSRDTKYPEYKEEFTTVLELEEHFIAEHEVGDQQFKEIKKKLFPCNECGKQYVCKKY